MDEKKDIGGFALIFVVIFFCFIYFFGCTDIKKICFEWGITGKGLYCAANMLIAGLTSYLIFRHTEVRQWIREFSGEKYRHDFIRRYHINTTDVILLVMSMIVGGILRFSGNNWGLTSIFQPDECKLVNPVIEMVEEGHLYPTSFYYPNQFTSKIAAIITYIFCKRHGILVNEQTIQAYFINRYVVAAFGIASIVLVFLIGNYLKEHLGAIVGWLTALYPIYVLMSKQVTGDTTVFFFLTLLLLFSLRYMERKSNLFLVLMSMAAALATLEKWHGAIGCAYIAVVIVANSSRVKEILAGGVYSAAAYIVSFGIFAPNLIQHLDRAIIDGFIRIAVYDGRETPSFFSQLRNYIDSGILHITGIAFLILFILGIIYLIRNFNRQYMILLLGILKLIVLCFMNRGFFRWGLEFYLDYILLAGMGIYMILKNKYFWSKVIGIVLLSILVLDFGTGSLQAMIIAMRSQQDTRLLQEEYCDINGITLGNSLSEYYTGFVPGGWVGKKGKVPEDDLEGLLIIKDDQIYKTQDVEYVIVNLERGNHEIHLMLEEYCTVVQKFESIVSDIFWSEGMLTMQIENRWADFEIINANIELMRAVLNGENTGDDIVIYDVRNLEYCSEE